MGSWVTFVQNEEGVNLMKEISRIWRYSVLDCLKSV